MESQDSRRLAVTLEGLAAQGADSQKIADAIVSTWHGVDAALAPVIGGKGVVALYGRSLYLVRAAHPWLGAAQGADNPMDFLHLRAVLAQQESSQAAAAGGAHLQILYELLVSLIGPSLTGKLLRSAWDNPFNGATAAVLSP